MLGDSGVFNLLYFAGLNWGCLDGSYYVAEMWGTDKEAPTSKEVSLVAVER